MKSWAQEPSIKYKKKIFLVSPPHTPIAGKRGI